MNPRTALVTAFVSLALAACGKETASPAPALASGTVQVWPLPAAAGSSSPGLSIAPDGRLLLSWMNRQQGRRNALQFSSFTEAGGWQSQPRTIAVGHSLLVNGADVPHLLATPDGALWMQWLQASAAGPGAYDTVLARSRDGGMTWTQLTRVNDDQAAAEHGFAAMWADGVDRIGIAWLDGREQAAHGAGGHGEGAMQLRANGFDLDLSRGTDAVVDARTCDCCRVDAAATGKGPLLVYRDRDGDELRDIAVVRREGDAWTTPKTVHADGWKVEACPVNGPAVAARGNEVVVAWYSEAGDKHAVRIARSVDAGDQFAEPVEVDAGEAVRGQVDVALDAGEVWVSWLREEADGQTLMLARYGADPARAPQRIEVAKLQARGMASGVPALAVGDAGAWLVWTDVADGVPRLQGAHVVR